MASGARKWPVLVVLAMVVVAVITGAVAAGSTAAIRSSSFFLTTHTASAWSLASALVSSGVFAAFDRLYTSTAWDWLGSRETYVSSNESELKGRFVLRWRNTHSSHALVAAGAFALAREDARMRLSGIAFGVALIALGILSFAWWASRSHLAQRFDNLFMETFLLALSVHIISLAVAPVREPLLVAALVAVTVWRGRFFSGKAALFPCAVSLLGSAIFSANRLGGSGSLGRLGVGVALMLCGVIAKVEDQYGWQSGTACFHYMEAAGVVLIFLWAQTLPLYA